MLTQLLTSRPTPAFDFSSRLVYFSLQMKDATIPPDYSKNHRWITKCFQKNDAAERQAPLPPGLLHKGDYLG